jgi:hypothetical protein
MALVEARALRVALALGGLLAVAIPRQALAFCVATTCDPKKETCQSVGTCITSGAKLHWASRCLSFGVQKDGSPLRHISYETTDAIVRTAFLQWTKADCGGGQHPSFAMWDWGDSFGGIICDQPEFNETKPNANVWMFRDDGWPYQGKNNVLALTSTLFDKASGALLDADVEINSFGTKDLTTTTMPGSIGKDLASIVTHEAGHFLGLAHSQVKGATMSADYVAGDLDYRSLHADDQLAICALYPANRDAPTCRAPSPPHGFSLYCGGGGSKDASESQARGCAARPLLGGSATTSSAVLAAALATFVVARRRRRWC